MTKIRRCDSMRTAMRQHPVVFRTVVSDVVYHVSIPDCDYWIEADVDGDHAALSFALASAAAHGFEVMEEYEAAEFCPVTGRVRIHLAYVEAPPLRLAI